MDEYISRKALIEHIKDLPIYMEDINGLFDNGTYNKPRLADMSNNFYCDDVISSIENASTADVAPKSEVEYWKQQCFHACMNNGCLDVIKTVAREIFEEIESRCLKHIDRYNRYIMCCEEFSELKKKYT